MNIDERRTCAYYTANITGNETDTLFHFFNGTAENRRNKLVDVADSRQVRYRTLNPDLVFDIVELEGKRSRMLGESMTFHFGQEGHSRTVNTAGSSSGYEAPIKVLRIE